MELRVPALRLEDKGWKGLERIIVQPILDLHLPGQELGLDVSHILDYDVAVTSSGHFHLAVLEDPAAIHPTEEDEENVHIAGGVIVTNSVFLQRRCCTGGSTTSGTTSWSSAG